MKKIVITSVIVVMVLGIGILFAAPNERGNGLPKGKSYNFNVIGVPNELPEGWDGGQGKRIFVLRDGTTWFYIQGAEGTFEILDRNGTDGVVGGHGTAFPPGTYGTKGSPGILLPYSGGTWDCEIFVRLLGPVDSSVKFKSYVFDDGMYVHIGGMSFTAEKSSKFSCKTNQLLADGFQDILWEMYDKDRFRIMQFRIFVYED